jgi:FkbM family methyltransferase
MNITYFKNVLLSPKLFEKLISALSAEPKPLKFLISRLLMVSGFCRLFKIQRNGYSLHFYPTSLSAQLWVSPAERLADELFFIRYLKNGDNAIDIGANIGTLTSVASSIVGEQGKIYSIEAHPQIHKYLLGNIALNNLSNIEIFNCAVGETARNIIFSNLYSDDRNQVSTDGQGIQVSMVTLDELLTTDRQINLLKIDVEGYEKFVFEGAARILDHTQCVYLESWETHFAMFGYSTVDVIDLLNKKGFKCFKFNENDTITELPDGYISGKCENLIAVRNIQDFITRTNYSF